MQGWLNAKKKKKPKYFISLTGYIGEQLIISIDSEQAFYEIHSFFSFMIKKSLVNL